MLHQQLLSQWNTLKTKLLKQNQTLVNLKEDIQGKESALQFLRTILTNSEKDLETVKQELTKQKKEFTNFKEQIALKLDPTWDKFLDFCRSYKIEEEYATETRNIGSTFYWEFPNCMGRFENNLKEKGSNEYRKFVFKDNLIDYGFSEVEVGKYQFGKQIIRVYDKWKSELYVRI